MADCVAIVLAAGKGTRMKSSLPKVLNEVAGEPMLAHVLRACREAGTQRIYVVVGHGAEQVREHFADATDIEWVMQAEQRGTGHAVLCCAPALRDFEGQVLILCGDGPLIRGGTLATLVGTHEAKGSAVTLATAMLDDPAGYGRIVRDEAGEFLAIVEHKDCRDDQLAIHEVNPSYYCFEARVLFQALRQVTADNAKQELYLTDAVGIALGEGKTVTAFTAVQPDEAMSINTDEQLATVDRIMSERMAAGQQPGVH